MSLAIIRRFECLERYSDVNYSTFANSWLLILSSSTCLAWSSTAERIADTDKMATSGKIVVIGLIGATPGININITINKK